MKFKLSKGIQSIPPYPFAKLDAIKKQLLAEGRDLIDLTIGDPDLPTPQPIIETLAKASTKSLNHRYPTYQGMDRLREEISTWFNHRFGVQLDPLNEMLILIGSKEGIAHFPMAFVNPGDIVLVPTPGYPVYSASTLFCNAKPYLLTLDEKNGFFPILDKIPKSILKKAKLLFLNYPNNPTSATTTLENLEYVVHWARKNNLILCHDMAYSEIYFEGRRPHSILEIDGAKEIAIEFHSFSKTYNMTGWRLGWACGNTDLVQGLGKIKTNIDSGVFQAVQEAGISALHLDHATLDNIRDTYQARRDVLAKQLINLGFHFKIPQATFYFWIKTPKNHTSESFVKFLMEKATVLITPGTGFGKEAKGYVRMTLTAPIERIEEACHRITKTLKS